MTNVFEPPSTGDNESSNFSKHVRDIKAAASRSLTQVHRFVTALKDVLESPDELRLLFAALGESLTAELISLAVEPATWPDSDVGPSPGTIIITDCVRIIAHGLRVMAADDLHKLVAKWAEAENLNRFLATEIFSVAEPALATSFASAAITRCLESTQSIAIARALAASASHVLTTVPGVDLFAILVSLLRSSGKYEAFLCLALGGESELPSLTDIANNPSQTVSTINHREFGRVEQLMTMATTCLRERINEFPIDLLSGIELAEEYDRLLDDNSDVVEKRVRSIESEIDQRIEFVTLPPRHGLIHFRLQRGSGPHHAFNAFLTPNIAEQLLRNVSEGRNPFEVSSNDEKSVYWFESIDPEKSNVVDGERPSNWTSLPVEVVDEKPTFKIDDDELSTAYEQAKAIATTSLKAKASKYQDQYKDKCVDLRHNLDDIIDWCASRLAESQVWIYVDERVTSSDVGIAILDLRAPPFDDITGSYIVVRDPKDVHAPNAVPSLVENLARHGMEAEPYVLKAASVLFETMKEAGHVRAAFQIGGRVLLVLKLAKDTYRVITAKNKVKASVEVAGGWAGAAAAGSTFAYFFVPAQLIAGPAGWVAHGVGTVLAGAIGYWFGTSVSTRAYHLVVIDSDDK